MEMSFEGLTALREDFEYIRNYLPYVEDELLEKSGKKLRKYCKDRTPIKDHKGKHVKNSYKLSEVKRESDVNYIEMANTSPHFHLVERGHRQVSKSGREIGFIPGIHMVERGSEEFDAQFPEEVEKMLDKMLKKVNG
ncbi:HK97 gp10 family phage protein [Clostridium botulinum]|uniref:HK97 gp10 family phage protein n=1 Tax=Clostridium botulinum TaxID=1491 RepID=UPI0005F8FB13|nr:HK97 gp10 family phage protein [Clostridium botulinum]